MNIAQSQKLSRHLANAERVRQLLLQIGQTKPGEELHDFIESIKSGRFLIGVVGSAKRGKSTLINGLLGRKDDLCAPIDAFPATNVISLFVHGATPSIQVFFTNGNEPKTITENEICLYVTEKHNPSNVKQVRSVEVHSPFPGLENGVILVDTPGADNALSALHGQIVCDFLPKADAVIFLVTGETPLTASEQSILRDIHGNDTRKLFFAINKIDRVESGDLEQHELAEGIDHNRRILADAGFANATLHQISARNYFEKGFDAGTEELLKAVRHLISSERLEIVAERITSRLSSILHDLLEDQELLLSQSTATREQLEIERKELEKAKVFLKTGRLSRENGFRSEWDKAFDSLESVLKKIRRDLSSEYKAVIENTGAIKVQALAQTIHADIAVSFSERIRPAILKCEDQIQMAQNNLAGSIRSVVMHNPLTLDPSATHKDTIKGSLSILSSGLPAAITGSVAASLPGLVGSMIASTIPTVAAVGWNPATWVPYLFSGGSAALLSGTSAAVVATLSIVATPIAIGSFAFAAYRMWSAWRGNLSMQKNELVKNVNEMLDEACSQVSENLGQYKKLRDAILMEFETELETKIANADARLGELIDKRPSPQQILEIENNVGLLKKEINTISVQSIQNAEAEKALPEYKSEAAILFGKNQ